MRAYKFSFSKSTIVLLLCITMLSCNKRSDTITTPPPVNPDTIVETKPAILSTVASMVSPSIGGYYLALPSHYQETKKNYPVIIFFHGIGQAGNGNDELRYLLNDGIGKLLKEKKFPPSFRNANAHHSFIVILPQFRQRPSVDEVLAFTEDVIKKYRIDSSRIYLSGLSLGGTIITETASTAPEIFAAIAPMAGIDFTLTDSVKCEGISQGKLPVWVFHNTDDPMISGSYSTAFVSLINHFNPAVIPRLTIFDYYGHDAWTMALDPAFRQDNMNVYEWMLRHSR